MSLKKSYVPYERRKRLVLKGNESEDEKKSKVSSLNAKSWLFLDFPPHITLVSI